MNDYIHTAILIVAAYGIASIVRDVAATLRGFRRWATPRDPNPEPGPRVTPESLAKDGLPGLYEERAEILRRLKREHVELQMLDPADDGFSDEYDQRIDRKHNLHQQLFAIDMMLKGCER